MARIFALESYYQHRAQVKILLGSNVEPIRSLEYKSVTSVARELLNGGLFDV